MMQRIDSASVWIFSGFFVAAILSFFVPLTSFSDKMALCGIVLTIGGFGFTVLQIHKIQTAAEAASSAVTNLERHFDLFQISNLCESCIRVIQEVQRCHDIAFSSKKISTYYMLQERYRELIPLLVQFRERLMKDLTDQEQTLIQKCIRNIKMSEKNIRISDQKNSENSLPDLEYVRDSVSGIQDLITKISVMSERKVFKES